MMTMINMSVFTLTQIKDWLAANHQEFLELNSEQYPALNNQLVYDYKKYSELISYYEHNEACETALKKLYKILGSNFNEIQSRTQEYEILGSQTLLLFEVNYFDWTETIASDLIKIKDNCYTPLEPLENLHLFCKVFNVTYWDYQLHLMFDPNKASKARREIVETIKEVLSA